MGVPCFLLFGQLVQKSQVANLGKYSMMPWKPGEIRIPVGTLTTVGQDSAPNAISGEAPFCFGSQ